LGWGDDNITHINRDFLVLMANMNDTKPIEALKRMKQHYICRFTRDI
jgi:hypothetical protein